MPIPPIVAATRKAVTQLVLEMFRLNGTRLETGDALVGDPGLTSGWWQVMGAASLSPMPLPAAHLARTTGFARRSVQRLVDEMKEDGLVHPAPNQHHRRARPVLLTEAGKAACRAAMGRQERWADRVAAGLPAQDLEAALAIVEALRRRLDGGAEDRDQAQPHQEKGTDNEVC